VNVNLAILVGGKSKRFGSDKCTHEINGKRSIDWINESIGFFFEKVLFIGKNDRIGDSISDLKPGFGPISGLETAILNSQNGVFLVSCDMPFIKREIVDFILRKISNYSIVCPVVDGIYQVTHAFYSSSILEEVKKEMLTKNPSLKHLVSTCPNSLLIEEKELKIFKDYKNSFSNFNFPDDLNQHF
jgi:molybdopterin-guanine dinucleotide biosynthesis protein A